MIVFITAHDNPTIDNLTVAGHLALVPASGLCGHNAVRSNLIAVLTAAPAEPFLAFSHGQPKYVVGNDGQPAITVDDILLLAGRESFALACHTSAALGPAVSAQGGTWFGFSGPINCLPADPAAIHHFIDIVDFVANCFPGCNTPVDAQNFILSLASMADAAHDAITSSGTYTFEILHALRDLTRRLRIWLPGAADAVKHPEAFGDVIL